MNTFYDDVRNYVFERIQTLDDIGQVHHYHRYLKTAAALAGLFLIGRQFRGWMFTREAANAVPTGGNIYFINHEFVIRPYYGVEDSQATELEFQRHIDLVIQLFEADYRLGGLCHKSSPISARRITHRSFAGNVCHSADLVLIAQEARIREI